MKPKKKNDQLVILKAARKISREEEIRLHGKPINYRHVQVSKKVYNRRRNKADEQGSLPSFFANFQPESVA